MSITEQITSLVPYIPPEQFAKFEELAMVLLKYSPEHHLEKLTAALESEDYDKKEVHTLIDDLQTTTAQHKKPEPTQYNAFKTDLKRFFDLSHTYIKLERPESVLDFLGRYSRIFGVPKRDCGRIMTTCKTKGCEGRFTSLDQFICPVCDATRNLCGRPPTNNGRCLSHRGSLIPGPLSDKFTTPGRAKIYGQNLQGELQQWYIDAVTDPDYLSVAPEIGALASRSAELMRDIGDTDYLAVSAKTRQAIRNMRNAANEDDIHAMLWAADEIEAQLTAVADDKRRWDEIAAISGRLGRLTETERKRIIEAQKVITVQEMFSLQQETLMQIRDAFAIVAADVIKWVEKGKPLEQPRIRQHMLKTLHRVMQGDINLSEKLIDDEPLVIEGQLDE